MSYVVTGENGFPVLMQGRPPAGAVLLTDGESHLKAGASSQIEADVLTLGQAARLLALPLDRTTDLLTGNSVGRVVGWDRAAVEKLAGRASK